MAEAITVRFYNDGSTYRLRGKRRVARWLSEAIRAEGYGEGEVSVIFCSPERHLEINKEYLGHDYFTDVITFDYSDRARGMVSGDVFIDPRTVRDNAASYGVTARDEMLRVTVHGVLHLCGYGDKTPKEQKIMRSKEDHYLELYMRMV